MGEFKILKVHAYREAKMHTLHIGKLAVRDEAIALRAGWQQHACKHYDSEYLP